MNIIADSLDFVLCVIFLLLDSRLQVALLALFCDMLYR